MSTLRCYKMHSHRIPKEQWDPGTYDDRIASISKEARCLVLEQTKSQKSGRFAGRRCILLLNFTNSIEEHGIAIVKRRGWVEILVGASSG